MVRIVLILLLLACAAFAQRMRVAIINTVDDGEPPVAHLELNHLTDKFREIAVKSLPQESYFIMTQQSIVAFFGSQEEAAHRCRESEGCLARLGREINADYIAQGRIGRFGGDLTIKFEFYDSRSGNLVSSFTGNSKDVFGLLGIIEAESVELFDRMSKAHGADAPGVVSFAVIQSYIDGVGRGESWSLSIDGEMRGLSGVLLPVGEHLILLKHRCYNDIQKKILLEREYVFDMSSKEYIGGEIVLKKAALDLRSERGGIPIREPVFINGKRAGQTPFVGNVPLCSVIEVGNNREVVNVKLEEGKNIRYVKKSRGALR